MKAVRNILEWYTTVIKITGMNLHKIKEIYLKDILFDISL